MTDKPVDLGALQLESAEYEALVARIMAAAAPELDRRAARLEPAILLEAWWRPILAFAATIVVIAAATFAWTAQPLAPEGSQAVTLAEEMGVPTPVASWVTENREPTTEDLLVWIADAGR